MAEEIGTQSNQHPVWEMSPSSGQAAEQYTIRFSNVPKLKIDRLGNVEIQGQVVAKELKGEGSALTVGGRSIKEELDGKLDRNSGTMVGDLVVQGHNVAQELLELKNGLDRLRLDIEAIRTELSQVSAFVHTKLLRTVDEGEEKSGPTAFHISELEKLQALIENISTQGARLSIKAHSLQTDALDVQGNLKVSGVRPSSDPNWGGSSWVAWHPTTREFYRR